MELKLPMELQLPSFPFLAAILLFSLLVLKRRYSKSQYPKPPPGPSKLPLIGSMHHLLGTLPWQALGNLAEKYGPLIQLKTGEINFVVASSPKAAEEILKTQDLNFAYRPRLAIGQVVGYGCTDIAFAPYGSYWKMLRKICFTEVLSTKRVRSFSTVRRRVIRSIMKEISQTPPQTPVNLNKNLFKLANTFISQATFGSTCEHQERFIEVAKQALEFVAGFYFGDVFPSLKFLDIVTGARSRLRRIHLELDEILNKIIKEHREKAEAAKKGNKVEMEEEDFVDTLLRLKDSGDLDVPMTVENVKAVVLDMFIGGTETSASIVEWAMSELIRNPEKMEKAQKEVRGALRGRDTLVESDVSELHYLSLIIKETMRLHPPVPLLVLREAQEDCDVLGYHIKAGSRIAINAYSIARNAKYWDEPLSFKPERFDGSAVDFKGFNFEYLPFGSGRRVCPGMTLGMTTVHNVLANLLLYFDWQLPAGMKAEELDMTETTGSNASRKAPLFLRAANVIPIPATAS